MKSVLITLLMLAFGHLSAQEQLTTSLTVTVDNAQSSEGNIHFGLYTKDNFMKAAPYKGELGTIENGIAIVEFSNIPLGEYAVMCFHDKNGNGKMDFDEQGMPLEPYGFLGNSGFGPPEWNTAKIKLDEQPKEITIKIYSI